MESKVVPDATAARLHAGHMEQLATQQPLFVDRQLELNGGTYHVYQWTVPFFDAQGRLQGCWAAGSISTNAKTWSAN